MKKKAQRIAIAEACGWVPHNSAHFESLNWLKDGRIGTLKEGIPNYCSCLNAMHEAEKTIVEDQDLWISYTIHLENLCPGRGSSYWDVHATADKKAESFLVALGKWKETER